MKIFLEFEETEKMSNIGFAKAITELNFTASDLQEIGNYLMIYSNARAKESLEMACVEYKRSAE
jgi:hypothetical protein